jgi:hypothetical protein
LHQEWTRKFDDFAKKVLLEVDVNLLNFVSKKVEQQRAK